jgi:glyoxylase-like metal-dependent hydrolase (beta-lactamase superfamily II)
MQIAQGVYLVNGIPYGFQQNSYVIKLDDSQILIDSGDLWLWDPPNALGMVKKNCVNFGIDPNNLSHLLLTHAHFDHSSHALDWKKIGIKIVSSKETAEAVASGDERCIGYAVNRKFQPAEVDIKVVDGQELRIGDILIHCISAPGHTKGSMIYEIVLNEKTFWFVGDIVVINENLPYGLKGSLGFRGGPDFDGEQLIKTLRNMYIKKFDCLLSGHGHPCLKNPRRLVEHAYTQAMCELR